MIKMLEEAAFGTDPINEGKAQTLINNAGVLLASVN